MGYGIVKIIFTFILKIFFRMEVEGRENIPETGPLVMASNHLSVLDPPVIGTASTRKPYFMAKEEIFVPIFGDICKFLGAFPIKRGNGDMAAIRYSLSILKNGEVLAVFPEGTRSKTGKLGTAEPGTMLLAAKGKAAIIPTCLSGTDIFRCGKIWPKVKVSFGKPIPFPESTDKETLKKVTDELMEKIAILQEGQKI